MKFAPDSKCTCSCFGQLSNAPNARDPNSIPNRSRKICIEVCHIKRILQVVEDPGQLDLPLNAARFALTRFASPTPVSVPAAQLSLPLSLSFSLLGASPVACTQVHILVFPCNASCVSYSSIPWPYATLSLLSCMVCLSAMALCIFHSMPPSPCILIWCLRYRLMTSNTYTSPSSVPIMRSCP